MNKSEKLFICCQIWFGAAAIKAEGVSNLLVFGLGAFFAVLSIIFEGAEK